MWYHSNVLHLAKWVDKQLLHFYLFIYLNIFIVIIIIIIILFICLFIYLFFLWLILPGHPTLDHGLKFGVQQAQWVNIKEYQTQVLNSIIYKLTPFAVKYFPIHNILVDRYIINLQQIMI